MHASLADQLADLVQNALEAGAETISVLVSECGPDLSIVVTDDGCGMDETVRTRALDPFCTDGKKHAHRHVGLGLAFLKQMADATEGRLDLCSTPGQGTCVRVALNRSHVDLPPLGPMSETLAGLLAFAGDYELSIERERDGRRYTVTRSALRNALGELESAISLAMARDYFAAHEAALGKGNTDDSNDT